MILNLLPVELRERLQLDQLQSVLLRQLLQRGKMDEKLGTVHHTVQVEIVLRSEQRRRLRVALETDFVHLVAELVLVEELSSAHNLVRIRDRAEEVAAGGQTLGRILQHALCLWQRLEAVVEGKLATDDVEPDRGIHVLGALAIDRRIAYVKVDLETEAALSLHVLVPLPTLVDTDRRNVRADQVGNPRCEVINVNREM